MTFRSFSGRIRYTRRQKHPGRVAVQKHGYGRNWRSQKAKALLRDEHRCVKCGNGNDVLHVHHKRKISYFYDRESGTINYEKANDLDNLETLCPNCHKVADGHKKMIGFRNF